ncbi:COG4705 family protein [Lyngbya aestuarii]|uniref:COG4705 family protein n=1 Tax=Lyngbya aestuarii TaxID=118322 RepID=UPI00403DD918
MSKLPQITAFFWIMKICATTLGETAGDLLSMTLNVGYAVSSMILIGVFLATLVTQLVSKSHNPLLYWTVILSTSTAGTTISDYMDRTLGLGYATGSMILVTILVTILAFWRFRIGSLSVTNIRTSKVELLYWSAILVSNTLGTALGDFLADSSGLGFAGGALLISSLLALVLAAHYYTQISTVMLFWIAFVLTRPFGATLGDVLTKSHEKGGLGYGTVGSSIVLLSILGVCVLFTTLKQRKLAVVKISNDE